jgi:DNA-binding winged helix-turn-helix (wHTH) protein
MDSLINAAARALSLGDPVGALKHVALREDAPALALRGTAMAQLGDLERARALLRRAARAYGSREGLFRARCLLAEAEIALASRDLSTLAKPLSVLRMELERFGDHANATHARHVEIRRLVLIGRLDDAERALSELAPGDFGPAVRAINELLLAGIAIRRIRAKAAGKALARARAASIDAKIPALQAEVDALSLSLASPAACLIKRGKARQLRLHEVELLFSSPALIVDACRFNVRMKDQVIELAKRPALFILARLLAEAWPGDVARETLVARAYRARGIDESYRARLRVEIGRLRRALKSLAEVNATPEGFKICARATQDIVVLAHMMDEEHAAVLALMGDGESWSSSALAIALGTSPRTVQRALESLAKAGKVQALGQGRARRWISGSLQGITTSLLLPAPLARWVG